MDDKKTCGDCIYYTGEECDGPGGSREGSEVYSGTTACDCYDDEQAPEIFPGTKEALRKLGVPNAGGNATERSEGRVDHNVGRQTEE